MRKLGPEAVEDRGLGEIDGIAGPGRRAAPAVEDDERYKREPARHTAANAWIPEEAADERAINGRLVEKLDGISGLTEPP